MSQKINIYAEDWCDLVFDEKNKDYGAYLLRKGANKRHGLALLGALAFFSLAITSPMIIKSITAKSGKETLTEVTTLTKVKVEVQKKEEVKVEEEKPEEKIKSTIQFIPPVIKEDNEVKEEMKTQDELNKSLETISAQTVVGNSDDGADASDLVVQKVAEPVKEEIFESVQQMPSFPGGDAELYRFLGERMKYPEMAKQAGLQGKLFVEFVVNRQGEISEVKIIKGSIGGGCEEEAVRLIKLMPKWTPGKQNGASVSVRYRMPMVFQLKN